MSEHSLTPQQLEALLTFASQKLGVSPQQLAKTIQSGDTGGLGLSAENSKKLDGFLNNPGALDRLIQSPQAQQVLQQLLQGKQGE